MLHHSLKNTMNILLIFLYPKTLLADVCRLTYAREIKLPIYYKCQQDKEYSKTRRRRFQIEKGAKWTSNLVPKRLT